MMSITSALHTIPDMLCSCTYGGLLTGLLWCVEIPEVKAALVEAAECSKLSVRVCKKASSTAQCLDAQAQAG